MPENEDNNKAEEQAEAIRKDGRWAATEGDDNAVYASDENYVGTEPERQNYAYEEQKPLAGEVDGDTPDALKAEKELFDRVAEENANLASRAVVTTRRGTVAGGAPHPTERGARPGYVEGGNREAVDVGRSATKGDSEGGTDTGVRSAPQNEKAQAEVAKGNTPAPAKAPAKD